MASGPLTCFSSSKSEWPCFVVNSHALSSHQQPAWKTGGQPFSSQQCTNSSAERQVFGLCLNTFSSGMRVFRLRCFLLTCFAQDSIFWLYTGDAKERRVGQIPHPRFSGSYRVVASQFFYDLSKYDFSRQKCRRFSRCLLLGSGVGVVLAKNLHLKLYHHEFLVGFQRIAELVNLRGLCKIGNLCNTS